MQLQHPLLRPGLVAFYDNVSEDALCVEYLAVGLKQCICSSKGMLIEFFNRIGQFMELHKVKDSI
ncbi:hypothetical protein MBAV_003850 [Candidatus Magnetobacterium bavaricum]|uniref:Uncharacterized protein n=1 Tax=Candidatus Magnetobacterium bavaricum TaxID=29290 RepID=A0A0F3GPY9_9BACT|nr:hypothetical protein MBAV_003850 [Candidatus Magnetobacterium bavaricum]